MLSLSYSSLLWLQILPSILEIVGPPVPARYIRDFTLISGCPCSICPSARCASAADIFIGTLTYLQPRMFFRIIYYNAL
jgi:hypothetical protein